MYNAPSARFERATFTTGIHRPEITKLSRTITEATLCLAEIRGKKSCFTQHDFFL